MSTRKTRRNEWLLGGAAARGAEYVKAQAKKRALAALSLGAPYSEEDIGAQAYSAADAYAQAVVDTIDALDGRALAKVRP
jgi:hypothetical protein